MIQIFCDVRRNADIQPCIKNVGVKTIMATRALVNQSQAEMT